ncbi:MAG TPA: MFS transporter [Chitinophagaceae bacterium]|nr:MFS transporter [Chitinophagaceae bacterium]
MIKPGNIITPTVWMISLVSLFTDFASEMLYPVMPVYLQHIGFSILLIGILEGVAEATAGLSKSYFGRLSDNSGKRLPFVQIGYFLSAVSKPMMAMLTNVWWIFFARTTDRLGKGIRTGARDALLSDEATPQTKATVFGYHRSMDTWGAVMGPAAAWIFLFFFPQQYKTLFLVAFIPGLTAVIITRFIKEKKDNHVIEKKTPSLLESFRYWRKSPVVYRRLLTGLLIFALFNSSDIFLLLKIKESGYTDTQVVGLYIFYNLVFAMFAFPVGRYADKIGLKKVFLVGLLLFTLTYTGFAINTNHYIYFFLFIFYGLYAASTEGVAKAWISNIADKKDIATAIGTYSGFQSIAALLASSIAGLLWFKIGSTATFLITAGATILSIFYLLSFSAKQNEKILQD